MELRHIQVSGSLEDIAKIGVVFLKDVRNGASPALLRQRMDSVCAELHQAIGSRPLGDLDSVKRTRHLYHRLGLDPTRERPTSERLLRRVVQGRPLPQVSSLVDAVNLASLMHQFPMGVYDWDRVVPPVLVRIGRPDEAYTGLKGETVPLEGKIVLVDGEGPFGSPSQDSPRALASSGTVRAVVILGAAADTPKTNLDEAVKELMALTREFCGSRVGDWGILG